ncbi:polysaccharide biosynthesis tyrosine autokinase [Pseudonocardia sp. TMWB2A]|uniref:polysaccharide biosynthesis tyrosine autokinase n=1 Tax=Pseudonocardia sp. TMWB2A TaxID=687430 RepID=UPI00307F46D5
MTVQSFLRTLREQYVLVAVTVLIGVAAAGAVFAVQPASYTASTSLYVSAQAGREDAQQAYLGAQLSAERVRSYTNLITGSRVLGGAAQALGSGESVEDLRQRVSATSPTDSVLIEVSATDSTPERAAQLADAVADAGAGVVSDLERPTDPGAAALITLRVVQPADVPTEPSSLSLPAMLAIGLILGAGAGILLALARRAVDTRVTSDAELVAATRSPVIGRVLADPGAEQHPLVVNHASSGREAEAYRQLRTNIQFIDVDNPRKVVVVTSAMPGDGKTTTVANLAIALGRAGSRVLLVDADMRLPRIASLFGLDNSVGLTRVISGQVPFDRAVQSWNGGVIDVLTSGPVPPNPSELLASASMRATIAHARDRYDMVLIDSPPVLSLSDTTVLAGTVDGAILVCRAKKTTRRQAESAAEALRLVGLAPFGSVLNRVDPAKSDVYGKYHRYHADGPASAASIDSADGPARVVAAPARGADTSRIQQPTGRPPGQPQPPGSGSPQPWSRRLDPDQRPDHRPDHR